MRRALRAIEPASESVRIVAPVATRRGQPPCIWGIAAAFLFTVDSSDQRKGPPSGLMSVIRMLRQRFCDLVCRRCLDVIYDESLHRARLRFHF
jgi:hypothetical protein